MPPMSVLRAPARYLPVDSCCLLLAGFLLYAAGLAVVVSFHEPAQDEADAWLAARDLPLSQIINFARHVGSPALWYLILMPFAKAGVTYASMLWVHYAIALAAAAALLALAPFPIKTRLLAVFSYYLAYQFAAIPRNYSLLALGLFLTAASYASRGDRPIRFALTIFFLASTSPFGTIFAFSVAVFFTIEIIRQHRRDRHALIALLILLLAGALAAVQLWPPRDAQLAGGPLIKYPEFFLDTLTRAFFIPFGSDLTNFLWLILNLVLLLAAIFHLARTPFILATFFLGLAALFYIFICKWCVPARHAGVIFLWLLFALWISQAEITRMMSTDDEDQRMFNLLFPLLHAALFAACIQTVIAWDAEIRVQYSHARQAAAVICAKGWDRDPIAAPFNAEAILPYLRCREFYNLNLERFASYNPWNAQYNNNARLMNEQAWQRIDRARAQFPTIRVIWTWPLPDPQSHNLTLLYKTLGDPSPTSENFYIYGPITSAASTP